MDLEHFLDLDEYDDSDMSEELVQRLFDGVLADREAEELLRIWRRLPSAKDSAAANHRVHGLFRFLRDRKTTLSAEHLHRLRSEYLSRYGDMESDADETASTPGALPDFEYMIRLAAPSPSLPRKADEAPPTEPGRKIHAYDPKASRSFLPPGVLALILLTLFGVAVFFEWKPPSEDHLPGVADGRSPIAVLTDCDEVEWSSGEKPPGLGQSLTAGALRFESGTIELLFYNGVRTVVEGPADLVLLDEKRVFCDRGTWSVTVPPQGSGFTIQTSQCTIRDIGTKFHAAIDVQGSEVHVLQGTVELERPGKNKMTLTTGREFHVRQQEAPRSSPSKFDPADFDRFVTKIMMRRRSDLFLQTLPVRRSAETRPVLDVEFADPSPRDAVVTGGLPVEGPAPESKAIRLRGSTDHIRLKSVGEVDAMTFVGWFRFNSLNAQVNPILMGSGSRSNGIVWQVTNQGRFVVGLRQKTRYGAGTFPTPVVVTPDDFGRWIQLALTVDGTKQQLAVYVDGNMVFSGKLPQQTVLNLNELDLGSWKSESGNKNWVWQLDGSVGPACVCDRVLELHEIRALSF